MRPDLDFSALPALCNRFHVEWLDLFGSATGDWFDPARSDLDFLVAFGDLGDESALRTYFGLREELVRMFGRSVDLVMESAVRNPFVRAEMEKQRQRVYPPQSRKDR